MPGSTTTLPEDLPVQLALPDRSTAAADPRLAGSSISSVGESIFAAARAEDADRNISLSPASIAIALAMLEPGTSGEATTQLRALLGIDDSDVDTFHASMNSLEQSLEGRTPPDYGQDNDPGDLAIHVANAAYLQDGYPFVPAYLDTIGNNYGPVLNTVDFRSNPEAITNEINAWIAEQTADRIPNLIPLGAINTDTRLALVNALNLDASWVEPLSLDATRERPFTLLDGSEVTVPLMQAQSSSSAQGDGWVAATKPFTGGLYAQFVLPDEGSFDEVANRFSTIPTDLGADLLGPARLQIPRFETRTPLGLTDTLNALGVTAPFVEGNLLRLADDPRLRVTDVLHETFVSIDEDGIEAAAATAVLGGITSAPPPGVDVVLDRPFLYRIVDQETGAVLFMGQIIDPTT